MGYLLFDEAEVDWIAEKLSLAGLKHGEDDEGQQTKAKDAGSRGDDPGNDHAEEGTNDSDGPENEHGCDGEVQRLFSMGIHDRTGLAFPGPDDQRQSTLVLETAAVRAAK